MDKRKKAIAALTLSALLAVSMSACGGNGNQDANNGGNAGTPVPTGAPAGTETAAAGDAEALYKANCIACHGAELGGGVGPNLTKVGAELSADEIHTRIENGGGGMPAFKEKLTADQINALAAWLSAKK